MNARWLIVVAMVAMVIESVGRYLFNSPTIWAHELCGLIWGFYILCGGIYVQRLNAHVSIDLIYGKLSPKRRSIIDVITYPLFFVFITAILWYAVPYGWVSMMRLEHSITMWAPPIWPLKVMVPIAVALLLLQGISRYIRSVYMVITGTEL